MDLHFNKRDLSNNNNNTPNILVLKKKTLLSQMFNRSLKGLPAVSVPDIRLFKYIRSDFKSSSGTFIHIVMISGSLNILTGYPAFLDIMMQYAIGNEFELCHSFSLFSMCLQLKKCFKPNIKEI